MVIDGATTLDPGANATVTSFFDGSNAHLSFGLPHGLDGTNGNAGGPGPKGDQADPGEVTAQQLTDALNNALAGTARNSASLAAYPGTFSDPPTQAEMQAFAACVEAMGAPLLR